MTIRAGGQQSSRQARARTVSAAAGCRCHDQAGRRKRCPTLTETPVGAACHAERRPEGPTHRRNAMNADHGMSRRRMLEMVGAGGFALVGGARRAWAQSAKRIERLAPELDGILDASQSIRELATGFGGDIGRGRAVGSPKALSSFTTSTIRDFISRQARASWSPRPDQRGQWAHARPPGPISRLNMRRGA